MFFKLYRASKNKIDDVPQHTPNKLIFWECKEKLEAEELELVVIDGNKKKTGPKK